MTKLSEESDRVGSESAIRPARLSLRMLRLYRVCDGFSGNLIYFMVVTGPWLFGTTRDWTIQFMDIVGLALGAMFLLKLMIRVWTGYRNSRWDERDRHSANHDNEAMQGRRFVNRSLAALTVLILGFCLTSVINASAKLDPETKNFQYYRHLAWLPSSHDQTASWQAFWTYLALAGFFWALHDWLVAKDTVEERAGRANDGDFSGSWGRLMPERLRRLLWIVSISGGLLGVESIAQRLSGTNNILFFWPPLLQQHADAEFGPYAYRSNGAQYFNLIWPLTLGFWWTMHRETRRRSKSSRFARHHLVLVAAMVMAACPIIATTRAGTAVDLVMMAAAVVILLTAQRKGDVRARLKIVGGLLLTLGLASLFGWQAMERRLEPGSFDEGLAGRNSIYQIAGRMADDFPLFGSGPGTFHSLYRFYQDAEEDFTVVNLHNDWLETLITFGYAGSVLVALAFLTVLLRWFIPGGVQAGIRLVSLIWLALAGCLAHARYDFPLQIHSVLAAFLLLCGILFSVSQSSAH